MYRTGLDTFANDVNLLVGVARIQVSCDWLIASQSSPLIGPGGAGQPEPVSQVLQERVERGLDPRGGHRLHRHEPLLLRPARALPQILQEAAPGFELPIVFPWRNMTKSLFVDGDIDC